jgi:hypothetical protein
MRQPEQYAAVKASAECPLTSPQVKALSGHGLFGSKQVFVASESLDSAATHKKMTLSAATSAGRYFAPSADSAGIKAAAEELANRARMIPAQRAYNPSGTGNFTLSGTNNTVNTFRIDAKLSASAVINFDVPKDSAVILIIRDTFISNFGITGVSNPSKLMIIAPDAVGIKFSGSRQVVGTLVAPAANVDISGDLVGRL